MKKVITMLSLLIIAAFIFAPAAQATKNYNYTLTTILSEICGGLNCEGDIVDGKLILIGKDGRKHVAPDGAYTDEAGKSIRVIDGKVLQKAMQPMKRAH